MIVFLASWLALSLVAGALWSLAMSRGGIVSEARPVPAGTNVTPIRREPVGLRPTA